MKRIMVCICFMWTLNGLAQNTTLPIQTLKGNDITKPLLFYISGDGGWNKFSTSFMDGLNKLGYPIIGLNSRFYFRTKKNPQQAANDIMRILDQYMKRWKVQSFILIGYSFGADVVPFVQTHLRNNLIDSLKHTVMLSPSKKTDFEVHILGMIGISNGRGESVPAEINKLTKPVTLVLSNEENSFPLKNITIKNVHTLRLGGGHHFEGHLNELVKIVVDGFKGK